MSSTRCAALVTSLILVACGGGGGGEPDAGAGVEGGPMDPFPEIYCPGSEGCTGTGDGVFRVGAATASIDPELVETEWDDEDQDNHWDTGESFTDVNGNGVFDAVWIAGFGNGRPATGFADGIHAKAIVLEWNDIRVGLVILDVVGWFEGDIEATRERIPASLDLDHVLIGATHVHEAPDTLGLWGRKELVSGVDPDYKELIYQRSVDALTDAVAALEPAAMSFSEVLTVDEGGDSRVYVGDSRDPVILDARMRILHFTSTERPGESIATLINWAAHPEYAGDENNLITSDYVHHLRDVVQNGIAENPVRGLPALEGVGGEVIFVNGALGGQIGPGKARPIGPDGTEAPKGLPKAEAAGLNLGRLALETMTTAEEVTDIPEPTLELRSARLAAVVENTFYHVGGLTGVFDRSFFGYDESRPIDSGNLPFVESRVTYLRIGTVGIVTAPGELHPELFVGGYDGSESWGDDIVDPENPNPPNLAMAPGPPYLEDLVLDNPGVEHALLFGATEDFLGYLVPSYNYVLDENGPYIEEADGDHYEETNSIGPLVEEHIIGTARELLRWRP